MRYLKNTWYVAAWSNELLTGQILSRRLLDVPVALFRRSGGSPAALYDRCPHRFAPLSAGVLLDDCIRCRYHGLQFDGTGNCVANPHGPVGSTLAVKAWPLFELHRAIWIWMGDEAKADPRLIPNLSYLTEAPDSAFSSGYIRSKGNYEIFVDNILDLSHTDYLHPDTLGGGAVTNTRQKVTSHDDFIEVEWYCAGMPPSPLLASLIHNLPSITDFIQRVRWYPPSVMRLTAATVAAGESEDNGFGNLTAHILTPETTTSTHYFFAATRNYCIDDTALNARIAETRARIFATEDKPMVESVQERMGNADFWELQPRLMKIDEASVRVRRALQLLIETETHG